MIILRIRLLKTAPVIFLIIALITTFGVISGLYGDTDPVGSEEINTVKWECSLCWSYVYDPVLEGVPFKTLPENWACPTSGCTGTKSNLVEEIVIIWVCPYCGYVYDPAVVGVAPFETLADDWTCPVCNSLKSDFIKGEEYGEYISSDPWIAHLQHILAMRSKHLVVLQRVIESHMAQYAGLSSISGLENAFTSSSKSVLKARAEIDAYLEYLSSLKVTIDKRGDEGNTEDEELLLNSEDGGNEDAVNGNVDGNNGNSNGNGNSEHTNNGKALGKNK